VYSDLHFRQRRPSHPPRFASRQIIFFLFFFFRQCRSLPSLILGVLDICSLVWTLAANSIATHFRPRHRQRVAVYFIKFAPHLNQRLFILVAPLDRAAENLRATDSPPSSLPVSPRPQIAVILFDSSVRALCIKPTRMRVFPSPHPPRFTHPE